MIKKDDMSIISLLARSKKRINVLKSLEKEDSVKVLKNTKRSGFSGMS